MNKLKNNLFTATVNWKTTVLGVSMIIAGMASYLVVMFDNNAETIANANVLIAEIMAGLGLIFARDADKSSLDNGIK